MEAPKFNNKPNQHVRYHYTDGCGLNINQDFFIGRSTAVVGVVFAYTIDGMYVLTAKRSKKMRDEPGKHGIPCGYLDWNETRREAMIREVYEETSMYLPEYDKYLLYNNEGKSIISKDNPAQDKRQNITEIYLSVFDFTEAMDKFPIDIENFHCKETEFVRWIKFETFYATCQNYQWAFHHDETIKSVVAFYSKIKDNIK
jgi:ADP-ribose pyrophosphatase YjhB (NUDIX family)